MLWCPPSSGIIVDRAITHHVRVARNLDAIPQSPDVTTIIIVSNLKNTKVPGKLVADRTGEVLDALREMQVLNDGDKEESELLAIVGKNESNSTPSERRPKVVLLHLFELQDTLADVVHTIP
jgi:hypothetical protein